MTDTKMSVLTELLQSLSAKPPASCRAERIDFKQMGMPEHEDKFALLIHNLFTPTECAELLEAAERSQGYKWEAAMVNVGGGRQRIMTDIRLCSRIMWDAPEVADRLLARIKPHLPTNITTVTDNIHMTGPGPSKRKETWEMTRLNERLRFLRYTKGMYFREHCDGSYVTPDGQEMSFLTVHIYLNSQSAAKPDSLETMDGSQKPLLGGTTRFFGFRENQFYDVNPTVGACLVFQHRGLCHSGEEVDQGTKYTMRTDIMYQKGE